KTRILSVAAAVLALGIGASAAHAQPAVGAVYTTSNATTGNQILVFDRHVDGTLTPANAVATGGRGTGAGLGNQSGLILSEDGERLLAVNASNNVETVFTGAEHGLRQTA